MPSFQDMVLKLAALKHQQTIYNEVVNFLQQFIEDEVHKPDRTLVTEDSGDVPQKTILEVIASIQSEHLAPIERAISDIESIKVEAPNGKQAGNKEAPAKGGAQEGTGKEGGKKASPNLKIKGGGSEPS